MDNATPLKNVPAPTTKDERIKILTKLDNQSLQKTLVFLRQLKRSGIGNHKIEEQTIQGLSNEDITWALHVINPLYVNLQFDWKNLTKFNHEKVFQKGKLTKVKIKLDGDMMNFPVFFLTGLDENSNKYAERTFMVGPQFELALSEIKEVLDRKNTYLNLINDEFFYHGSKLGIEPDSFGYIILWNIYTILNGKSGEISYKDLIKVLSKHKKFKQFNNEQIKKRIRTYVTSKTDGVGLKIKENENNGKPLIDTKHGYGIAFNNN